jgi:hypothetical protein
MRSWENVFVADDEKIVEDGGKTKIAEYSI